jgi:ribonuclease HI
MLPEAIVYCDGSVDKNRQGGWSAIIATQTTLIEVVGYAEDTTNNRMELMGAIGGLRELSSPHRVMLVSDSAYVCNTLKHKWYVDWFRQEFSNPAARKNLDLWHELVDLIGEHEMIYVRVNGHTDKKKDEETIHWNVRADELAAQARKRRINAKHVSTDYARMDLNGSLNTYPL